MWVDDPVVDAFLDAIRQGPQWGKVDRLDVMVDSGAGDPPPDFEIRPDR